MIKKISLKFRYVLWLIIPFLVWWALRTSPLSEVWKIVSRLTIPRIALLVLVNVAVIVNFSLRWKVILFGQKHRIPLFRLILYKISGFGLSYFTPGLQIWSEPFQIYLLKKREHMDSSTAVASVGLDKFIEVGAKFIFLVLGLLAILHLGLFKENHLIYVYSIIGALLLSPFLLFVALSRGVRPLKKLIGFLPVSFTEKRKPAKVFHLLIESEAQMGDFCRRQPVVLFWAFSISGISWVLILFEFWLSLYFLGVNLNIVQIIGALAAARFAFLIPVPAGIGTLEASQVLLMSAFGLNPAVGLAISLIIRGRDILFGAVGVVLVYILLGRIPLSLDANESNVTNPYVSIRD